MSTTPRPRDVPSVAEELARASWVSAEDEAALAPLDEEEVAHIRAVADDPNPYPYSDKPASFLVTPLGWRFMTKAAAEKIMRDYA